MNGRRQQVTLKPEVLRWARKRVDYGADELANKVGVELEQVKEWERTGSISLSHINRLASKTHTPLGLLYLSKPPEDLDQLAIADFRRGRNDLVRRPSIDLLETVWTMQGRQAWMREELLHDEIDPVPFVSAFSLENRHDEVAGAMRKNLSLERNWAARETSWEKALHRLRDGIENARILVMFSGTVGNNTHRKLDVEEFQGFTLVDKHAPLIFINGADYKSAQMFTLSHELAHIFIGKSGVSKFDRFRPMENAVEKFCDQVAAEFLVPGEDLREFVGDKPGVQGQYARVARHFKVSTIVAARRMLDLDLIDLDLFYNFYSDWKKRETYHQRGRSGGHFWNTQRVRIGRLFGAAIARAVAEGRLFYREAYSLTGLKGKTFDKFMAQVDEWR